VVGSHVAVGCTNSSGHDEHAQVVSHVHATVPMIDTQLVELHASPSSARPHVPASE